MAVQGFCKGGCYVTDSKSTGSLSSRCLPALKATTGFTEHRLERALWRWMVRTLPSPSAPAQHPQPFGFPSLSSGVRGHRLVVCYS
jgi:hypothetical protein